MPPIPRYALIDLTASSEEDECDLARVPTVRPTLPATLSQAYRRTGKRCRELPDLQAGEDAFEEHGGPSRPAKRRGEDPKGAQDTGLHEGELAVV